MHSSGVKATKPRAIPNATHAMLGRRYDIFERTKETKADSLFSKPMPQGADKPDGTEDEPHLACGCLVEVR